jgi:hypothetical protein
LAQTALKQQNVIASSKAFAYIQKKSVNESNYNQPEQVIKRSNSGRKVTSPVLHDVNK